MINPLHLQRQFLASTPPKKPFNPEDPKPKGAKVFLNSQDRIYGTTDNATFKINMPCEFTTSNIGLTLTNFIPNYPTGTDTGIVHINMVGVENPNSYSSRNQTTHRTIGTMNFDREGAPKDYPPAAMTANTTNITGQAYGNGTYIARSSSVYQNPNLAYDKNSNSQFASWGAAFGTYSNQTGVYIGSTTTPVDGSNVSGEWLDLETPQGIVITSYMIRGWPADGQGNVRSPNTFTIAGSTDGITYTRIDTRSNIDTLSNNDWRNTFTVSNNSNAFTRHRIIAHIVGNAGTNNFRSGFLINEMIYTAFATPQTPWSTITTTSSNDTTSPVNAFDYNSNTVWRTGDEYNSTTGVYQGTTFTTVDGSNMTGNWLQLQTAEPIVLQNYTITGDGNSNAVPNTFTLAASSNGTTYARIHTQSNINNWSAPWTFTFSNSNVPTSNSYTHYRLLTHTVGNGGSTGRTYIGIGEMRLRGFSNVGVDLNEFFIPPQPLSTNSSNQQGQPRGNGLYTASASTGSTTLAFNAFDYTLGGTVWTTSNLYNSTTGWYEGSNFTDVSGSNYTGEWVQIQTPYPVYLSFHDMAVSSSNTSLNTFTLAGSTNGSNFAVIHTIADVDNWGVPNWYRNFTACNNIPTPEPYTHWRLIVHRVGNSGQTNRTRPSVEVWQPRGFSSNRAYNFPPSNMTATTTTFSNLLTLANGTYNTVSSSNITTTNTSNTIPPTRLGQSNLNAEIVSTDRRVFDRPITLHLTSPSGLNLSTLCNWSAELSIRELP
jgi:hypothetical protein